MTKWNNKTLEKCLERMDGEWRARAFKDSVECRSGMTALNGEGESECAASSNKEIERESSETSRAQNET